MEYSSYNVNTPQWREITVGSHLPAELRKLAEIAHNLWWTWNDGKRLSKYIFYSSFSLLTFATKK